MIRASQALFRTSGSIILSVMIIVNGPAAGGGEAASTVPAGGIRPEAAAIICGRLPGDLQRFFSGLEPSARLAPGYGGGPPEAQPLLIGCSPALESLAPAGSTCCRGKP
jgi:hypothetical protein